MESKDHKDPISNDQFGEAENTQNSANTEESTPIEVHENGVIQEQDVQTNEAIVNEMAAEVTPTNEQNAQTEKESDTPDDSQAIEEDHEDEMMPMEDEEDEEEEDEQHDDEEPTEGHEPADYTVISREELVDRLKYLIEHRAIQKIRNEVESIKLNFYKKHKAEFERKRKEWVDAGGDIEQFEAPVDPMEPQIKELLRQYRDKKSAYNRDLENHKQTNLEKKQGLIEEIKELVNRNESVNQTFQDFKELQQRWREIGPVPQANLNDL